MKRYIRYYAYIALALTVAFTAVITDGPILRAADTGSKSNTEAMPETVRFYVGTYTRGNENRGIYQYELDTKTGEIRWLGLAGEAENPSFVALHPTKPLLYAVGEASSGGSVYAFRIEPETGKLLPLNVESSVGAGPCHLVVDPTGQNVLVANYGGGSVACLPIDEQGKLKPASSFVQHEGSGPDAGRQKGPHAHSVNMTPDNRLLMVNDLGTDQTIIYRLTPETGKLAPNVQPFVKMKSGAGPRHLTFDAFGNYAYVINELDSTITQLRYNIAVPQAPNNFTTLESVSTLPADYDGHNQTAEIAVHPSGKFLYGSNRGHNSIAVFSISPKTGKLTLVECEPSGGDWPRNFAIDPTGRFMLVANQRGDNIVVLKIDPETGQLSPTDVQVELPQPVCIQFVP